MNTKCDSIVLPSALSCMILTQKKAEKKNVIKEKHMKRLLNPEHTSLEMCAHEIQRHFYR